MGFQWFNDFAAKAKGQLAKLNNATFKDAAMSACALIAAADGTIEPGEKKKVANLIGTNDLLSVFDPQQLKQTFEVFCDKATDDFSRLDLLNNVRKLKGNNDQADYALKIALVIANADGEFEDVEKVVVKELCAVLGLPGSTYGV